MDGMIQYNPGRIGDYTAHVTQLSARFNEIAEAVTQRVNALQEYFNTQSGSGAFTEAQQRVTSGIDAVHQLFARHSTTVDAGLSNFGAADGAAAGAFSSAI